MLQSNSLPLYPAQFLKRLIVLLFVLALLTNRLSAEVNSDNLAQELRDSATKALKLLELASSGTAEQRVCFTCHGQAQPVFALVEATRQGFEIDRENLENQIQNTYAHLKRGYESYLEGKGQGGGVDTAGYALWTLEEAGSNTDEVTDAVSEYLLRKQSRSGVWKCSSDRPPSEASHFTTSYLALRALSAFSTAEQAERVQVARQRAAEWLTEAEARDTEDLVFALLSAEYVNLPEQRRQCLLQQLLDSQLADGGWEQKEGMGSDAYATGTVLYALRRSGISTQEIHWENGIRFLLNSQQADGSWHVASRSKPFQKYFESGFPHAEDQFISTTATSWATLAFLSTLSDMAVNALASSSTAAITPSTEPQPKKAPYSLILRGGRIVDGTGNPWYLGDVAIKDDRIVAMGKVTGQAEQVIDATGLVIAPGFVDMHSHSDWTLFEDGNAQSKIRQGVTTEVLGEGASGAPNTGQMPPKEQIVNGESFSISSLDDYFDCLEKSTISVNVASYVGINNLWQAVMGMSFERPTPAEIERMKELLAEGLQDGAFGLSSQVMTPPGSLATTEDLVALCEVVHEYGGIYSTHIRNEGTGVFDSVAEAIAIGERARVPVDVIHLKIADQQSWGNMRGVVEMFDSARMRGVNVQANVYPYTRGNNNLSSIVPPWAHEGGTEKMLERLQNPEDRRRIKRDIENGIDGWYNHYTAVGRDWSRMLISADSPYRGRTMDSVIEERSANLSPSPDPLDVFLDLLIEEQGSVGTVYAHHEERDMNLAMTQPWCSIGSDGSSLAIDGPLRRGNPHPRNFGTFPRVLGLYVRERGVLTLEDAVRKMTSLNAAKLGIYDRGILRPGMFADITLFDPTTIIDQATYTDPFRYNIGIQYVIVNGQLVLDRGEHTGARPGHVLRKTSHADSSTGAKKIQASP
ncbi:MAG: amidohydrolase family protein [bacterium]|nr:amidohydrolase family protein [bacterium]